MTKKRSSILLVAFAGLLIPLAFAGCGSEGNTTVPMDEGFDATAAEAQAAAEELPDASTAAP